MTKKIIIYLFIFLVIFLSIFFLAYFFSKSSIFNILSPVKEFPKERISLHLYDNNEVSINKVLLKIYYCRPEGASEFIIENWQELLSETAREVSGFYELQFSYNMKMDFKIYPEVVYLTNSADYFSELVIQDFVRELAKPHSESQSLKALSNEVSSKMKDSKEWRLSDQGTDGSYTVNLFVLELDINSLKAKEKKILGLNDESNNSLVFSTGFVDDDFKNFYASVVSHEIGHGLGVPKFYSYSGDKVKSSGVMGVGFTRKLKNNYLKYQIIEEMTD